MVRNKAVYLALGVRPDGTKEALGLWIEQTEGAKFWLRVMNESRTWAEDVLIAVVDGLNGFPEAINAVFPQTQVQTCIVHLLRHALSFASWVGPPLKLAAALRPDDTAVNAEAAREALEDFAAGSWGRKYPPIAPAWRRQWEQVIPFFAYPPEGAADHLHHQCHREPQ